MLGYLKKRFKLTMNMTLDRRIVRSRKQLGEALIALAIEKGYDQVTIQDVAERAGVGYRTFFRHYAGKDELLLSVAQHSLDELEQLIGLSETNPRELLPEQSIEKGEILFQFIQNHEAIFRVLLLERGSSYFLKPIIDHGQQIAIRALRLLGDDMPIPLEMIVNHMVAGTLSLARWWLENDMPYTPAQMGEHLFNLVDLPARQNLFKMLEDNATP